MYRGLHFKIILIFVIFTVALMAALGAVMVVGSFNYYNEEFASQMETAFGKEITLRLRADLEGDEGDYEVVYRFTDTWLTFQETNSRAYKTLKGARKWAAENRFELA